MSSKFSLIVSIPGKDPEKFELGADSVSIGRGPDNDIQVLVAEVSVKHGSISADGDTCKIEDNGSTNGTKVNGQKVGSGGMALSPMDKVLLGETIPAYFVPTAVLASTPVEELVASIEASPKSATPKTAPVAVAAPAKPGAVPTPVAKPGAVPTPVAKPAPVAPGAAPAAPGAVPAPAEVAAPAPAKVAVPAPAADSGATTVKLDQVSPSPGPVAPKAPAPVPGGVKPPTVGAPSAPGAPRPPQPVPLKAPAAAPKKPPGA